MLEEVVDVARDLARRAQSDADFETLHVRRLAGQQQRLQFAGGLEIGVHAALAVGDLLVEPGVFDRAGDLRREQSQRPHVLIGEEGDLYGFQVHHAHNAVAHDQRTATSERMPGCDAM